MVICKSHDFLEIITSDAVGLNYSALYAVYYPTQPSIPPHELTKPCVTTYNSQLTYNSHTLPSPPLHNTMPQTAPTTNTIILTLIQHTSLELVTFH